MATKGVRCGSAPRYAAAANKIESRLIDKIDSTKKINWGHCKLTLEGVRPLIIARYRSGRIRPEDHDEFRLWVTERQKDLSKP